MIISNQEDTAGDVVASRGIRRDFYLSLFSLFFFKGWVESMESLRVMNPHFWDSEIYMTTPILPFIVVFSIPGTCAAAGTLSTGRGTGCRGRSAVTRGD